MFVKSYGVIIFGAFCCFASINGELKHHRHQYDHHEHHEHHEHHDHHDSKWLRSESLDGNGLYWLDWKVVNKDIVFRITANTRGYVGLGFSKKSEKAGDADIALAWVDDRTGEATVLVSIR